MSMSLPLREPTEEVLRTLACTKDIPTGTHREWVGPEDTANGCEFGVCLECPLPKCKYEMMPSLVHQYHSWLLQDREIVAMLVEGVCETDIAEKLGMSSRQVWRIKAKHLAGGFDSYPRLLPVAKTLVGVDG